MSTPILPKRMPVVDASAQKTAIAQAMRETADLIVKDFETTVATWDHGVSFDVVMSTPYNWTIGTSDSIYTMLNAGTKRHRIRPRRATRLRFFGPFRAKTVPKSIFSGPGYVGGNLFLAKVVNHPGTKARQWDATIAKKYKKLFGKLMQQRIDAAVR